jgi:hypothetical protein
MSFTRTSLSVIKEILASDMDHTLDGIDHDDLQQPHVMNFYAQRAVAYQQVCHMLNTLEEDYFP